MRVNLLDLGNQSVIRGGIGPFDSIQQTADLVRGNIKRTLCGPLR